MQENFENTGFEPVQDAPDQSVDISAPIEQAPADEPQIEADNEGVFSAPAEPVPEQPVALTRVTTAPQDSSRRGFRAFIIALCALIALSAALSCGYLLGSNAGKATPAGKASITLNEKPQKGALTMGKLYEKCVDSVVGISVYNSSEASSASGVIFTADGYIITNDHIYENIASAKFYVYTSDGAAHPAVFVAGDTRSDIAVLRITDGGKYTPASFGNSAELSIGEDVCAIGCPISADIAPSITKGNISMLNRRLSVTSKYASKYIQTNAVFNPGSSGGALVNMFGQVVGITSAKISGNDYEGLFFAIPSTTVKSVAESLISNGCVKGRAKMGVSYTEISAPVADISNTSVGLYISEIADNSDAKNKLNVGDTLIKANGKAITSDDVLLDIIDEAKPGDTVTLTVQDEAGSKRTVSVKLMEDEGTSSYKINSQKAAPKSDGGEDNNSSDSSGTFNFPFGE